MDKQLFDLKIDPELSQVTPPLSEEAFNNLKRSILENGCWTPLMVWNGVIIDGHNRYRICKENNIPFAVNEVELTDKDEAIVWIIENQCCQRNLQAFERIEMVARYEDKISEDVARKRGQRLSDIKNGLVQPVAQDESERTRDIAAKKAGVSHTTYVRGKWLSQNADESTKERLRKGEIKINPVFKKLQEKEPENSPEELEEVDHSDTPDLCSYIEHQTEDPVMHTEPERDPRPYQFVRDQVEFAVDNMIADMKVGVYCLRDEDFDKKKELTAIIREGCKRAEKIIKEMEKLG